MRRYRLKKSGGQRTEHDFFFFFLRLGLNENTKETTMETEDLRKNSVINAKNYLMQERGGVKH